MDLVLYLFFYFFVAFFFRVLHIFSGRLAINTIKTIVQCRKYIIGFLVEFLLELPLFFKHLFTLFVDVAGLFNVEVGTVDLREAALQLLFHFFRIATFLNQ